jgi:hypothetical protein
MLADIARACALVLAAFCAFEAAVPRAGRTAAGFLLRHDSSFLRSLESAGSRVESFTADAILAAALAVLVTTAGAAIRAPAVVRAAAWTSVIGAAWIVFRVQSDRNGAWWPLVVCPLVATAAILSRMRGPAAIGAVAIQLGISAHAAWTLLLEEGSAAVVWLPRASEILVLGGVAVAGLAWLGTRPRFLALLASAVFVAACALAWAYPSAVQAILRHVLGVGAAGLAPAWTAGLAAAALAGLVCAIRAPWALAPLVVTLVCARRPEPWFLIGTLASSLLFCQSGNAVDLGSGGSGRGPRS